MEQTDNSNEIYLFKLFLNAIYSSISESSSIPHDYFLFQEITSLPLFISEKIHKTFIKEHQDMTKELFTEGIMKLLIGTKRQLAEILFDIQDYDNDGKISQEDSKLLFIHFHMQKQLINEPRKSESKLYQIIMNFYKSVTSIDRGDFVWKCMNTNGDLVTLFYLFISKMQFITQEQFDYFKEITTGIKKDKENHQDILLLKGHWKRIRNALLQSKDLSEYLYENACDDEEEDDNEELNQLEKFEKDISNAISTVGIDDYNNNEGYHCSTETKGDSEEDNRKYYMSDFESSLMCTSVAVDLFSIVKKRIFSIPNHHSTSDKNVLKYSLNNITSKRNIKSNLHLQTNTKRNENIIEQAVFTIKNFNEQYFYHSIPSNCSNQTSSSRNIHKRPSIKFTYNQNSLEYKKLTLINNILYESIFNYKTSTYSYQRIIYLINSYPQTTNPKPIQIDSEWLYPFKIISLYHGIPHSNLYFFKSRSECNTFISLLNQSLKSRNITNDYILYENTLGKGKFGIVKSGKSLLTQDNSTVAIKIITKTSSNYHLNQWEKSICHFLSNIDNTFIIKPLDIYETLDEIYYVYENIKGGDLNSYIKTKENSSEVLLQIAYQLLEAISVLHSYGIIHRDIKHTNILIYEDEDSDKDGVCIKIIDFGLSRVIGHDEMVDCPYGSLSFKSPELLLDMKYDFKVDIWSLGVTLFFITFKVLPFLHKNKSQLKKIIIKGYYSFPYDCSENTDVCFTMLYSMINDCLIREYTIRPDCKKILKKYFDQLHQYE